MPSKCIPLESRISDFFVSSLRIALLGRVAGGESLLDTVLFLVNQSIRSEHKDVYSKMKK